jgi:hypothetical protein
VGLNPADPHARRFAVIVQQYPRADVEVARLGGQESSTGDGHLEETALGHGLPAATIATGVA